MFVQTRPLLGLKKEGEDMMNWITEKQAAEAAKQGKIPALEWSLLHWQQPGMVGFVELAFAMKDGRFCVGPQSCACCNKYISVSCRGNCPLCVNVGKVKSREDCCGGKWSAIENAMGQCRDSNYSNASMQAFQDAAGELCKFIADVLEKEKAKEKKKCEPELRHGDYGISFGKNQKSIQFPMLAFKRDMSDGPLRVAHRDGSGDWQKADGCDGITWLGNIFDDLKRNSEDLREFEVCAHGNSNCVFKATLEGSDNIVIDSDNWNYPLEDVVKIHQQLGQIIAFAKRQENKK